MDFKRLIVHWRTLCQSYGIVQCPWPPSTVVRAVAIELISLQDVWCSDWRWRVDDSFVFHFGALFRFIYSFSSVDKLNRLMEALRLISFGVWFRWESLNFFFVYLSTTTIGLISDDDENIKSMRKFHDNFPSAVDLGVWIIIKRKQKPIRYLFGWCLLIKIREDLEMPPFPHTQLKTIYKITKINLLSLKQKPMCNGNGFEEKKGNPNLRFGFLI